VKGENSVKIYGNDWRAREDGKQHRRRPAKVPGSRIWPCCVRWGSRRFASTSTGARGALWARPATSTRRADASAVRARRSVRRQQRPAFSNDGALEYAVSQQLEAIRRIPIPAPASSATSHPGAARGCRDVRLVSGAAFIYREQQQRYVPQVHVGRDLAAQSSRPSMKSIAVTLPGGYRLEWVGNSAPARRDLRLSIAVRCPSPDRAAALSQLRQHPRRAAGGQRHPWLVGRIFALWVTYGVQRLLGHRFVALSASLRWTVFWCCRISTCVSTWTGPGHRHPPDLPHPAAAGRHDCTVACVGLIRPRCRPASVRRCSGRWRSWSSGACCSPGAHPDGAAGADHEILPGP